MLYYICICYLQWILDIREKVTMPDGTPIPIVLLANKSDLTDTSVQTDEIGRYCREYAIGAWFITSAKEDNNIGDITTLIKTKFVFNW